MSELHEWFIDQVRLTEHQVRAYVRRLGVCSDSVDDVAQEAYLTAFAKSDEFTRGGDFAAWVCQIARRQIANERRTETRRRRIVSEGITAHLLAHAATQPEPSAVHIRNEELTALRNCVDELPEQSQLLIRERYLEEVPPTVIATRMGSSSNQVRQRLLRLRRLLSDCVEKQFGDIGFAGGGT